MNDLQIYLAAMPGALSSLCTVVWLYLALTCNPRLGLADYGSKDQITTTVTTAYTGSFNKENSSINSSSDNGNVTISTGSSDALSNLGPLILAVAAMFGGLLLITR